MELHISAPKGARPATLIDGVLEGSDAYWHNTNDTVTGDRGEGIDPVHEARIPICNEETDESWQSTDWLVIHQHEGNTHLWIEPLADREPADTKRMTVKRVGKGEGSDVCVSGSLTATRPPGRISRISWPGGGNNTPGRGAT